VTSLVYVYAILPRPVATHVTGIDDRPVRWIEQGQLAAAVSDVPALEFEEEPLNAHIGDMAWLAPRAVAHQAVCTRLFEAADTLLPLAFGAVFRDDAGVRRLLTDQAETLRQRLDRVRGCAEWVLTLHSLAPPDLDTLSAASPAVQAVRSQLASSQPGRAHLLRRQLQSLVRDEARRVQVDAVGQVLSAVRQVAADIYQEPLPPDAVERPLLRASVLVRSQAEPEFLDTLDRLRRRWPEPTWRLEVTGPWPPYRFGGLDTNHA
jgi:hypothetical protein